MKVFYKIGLAFLLLALGVFIVWYFNTVTLTGRVVDLKGKPLPHVSFNKIYKIGDVHLSGFIEPVSEDGTFKAEDVKYGTLCILFFHNVVLGDTTYRLNLLEKCSEVIPFKSRSVGDVVINIGEALRQSPFDEVRRLNQTSLHNHLLSVPKSHLDVDLSNTQEQ